jgi:hypothetical protein
MIPRGAIVTTCCQYMRVTYRRACCRPEAIAASRPSIASVIMFLCIVSGGVQRTEAQTPQDLLTPIPNNQLVDATPAQSQSLEKLRRMPTTQTLNLVRINQAVLGGNRLRVSLPGDGAIDLARIGGERRNEREFSWLGRIIGTQGGSATLIVRNGEVTGSINSPRGLYRISSIGGGLHALVKVDIKKLPPEEPPSFHQKEHQRSHTGGTLDLGDQPSKSDSGPTQIDVLVAYTPAAKAAVSNIDATIALAIAEANQSYGNSNINIHLNLVDSFQVTYTESGKTFDKILSDFVGMTDVNQRRDQSAADLSALIIDQSDACGLADAIEATASTAFAVVYYSCATGVYSFAHELGHLMGARHDEQDDSTTTPFAYGHGFRHDPSWRTIMSYDCPASCPRLQFWSNPNIMNGPDAMGTATTNDNARVLNGTATTVAGFRDGLVNGSLLREDSGAIWVIFGGAKFLVPDMPTFTRLFGGKPVVPASAARVNGISNIPIDGTLLREDSGAIWVIFGGARFLVPDMPTLTRLFGGKPTFQLWDGALSGIPTVPTDGTLLREDSGAISVIIGGAKFLVPDMPTLTRLFGGIPTFQLWDGALSGIPTVPTDGTLLREEGSTQIFIVQGGRKVPAPPNTVGLVHVLWKGALSQIP